MFAENNEFEILTPSGWKDFKGVTRVTNKVTYRITLVNGKEVEATAGHFFFVKGARVQLSNLEIGDLIDTVDGPAAIESIEELEPTTVYDIIEVADEKHQFVINHCFITKNCDEFSFLRPSIAKEFWTAISPTLATGGKAIITSTPNSDEDQFALLWKGANKCEDEFGNPTDVGVNGFKAFRAFWNEHPDRDDTWAAQQRAAIGHDRFEREYGCEFVIADETLIKPTCLLELEAHDPVFKTGEVRWFKQPQLGHIYTVALDPSLGTGGDPAAIQVFDASTTEQVAEWKHNKTSVSGQVRTLAEIVRYIFDCTGDDTNTYYSIENNTIGEAALISLAEYGEENIRGYFLSGSATSGSSRRHRKGFTTTHKSKLSACAKFKQLVESGKMQLHSRLLIGELKNFVAIGTSYAAKPGETDDLVMATLLTVCMLQELQSYHVELDVQMRDYQDLTDEPLPFIMLR